MPFESGPAGCRRSVVISGGIPHGVAEVVVRHPIAHVLEAQTASERQSPSGLPLIVDEERVLFILHVLHRFGVVLAEAGHAARDKVGQVVAGAVSAPFIEIRGALGSARQTTASLI